MLVTFTFIILANSVVAGLLICCSAPPAATQNTHISPHTVSYSDIGRATSCRIVYVYRTYLGTYLIYMVRKTKER
jgi:hypothetical protein